MRGSIVVHACMRLSRRARMRLRRKPRAEEHIEAYNGDVSYMFSDKSLSVVDP